MKLLIFALGVIAGVAGSTFYQIFGKPVLPTPPEEVNPTPDTGDVRSCEHTYIYTENEPVQVDYN